MLRVHAKCMFRLKILIQNYAAVPLPITSQIYNVLAIARHYWGTATLC